jgi:hypothetical protein
MVFSLSVLVCCEVGCYCSVQKDAAFDAVRCPGKILEGERAVATDMA